MDELAAVPAVALYLDRVQAVDPDFALTRRTRRRWPSICARLDGLPLALELAASRQRAMLAARCCWPAWRTACTCWPAARATLPDRQQTLRGAIGWSFSLLNGAERALFRRLAVFAGSWTLEAARRACTTCPQPIAARETTPRKRSNGPPVSTPWSSRAWWSSTARPRDELRYRMLETIRAYAAESLAASREEEAVRRHWCAYYRGSPDSALAELGGPAQRDVARPARAERDNLRAVLRWLIDRGRADPAAAEQGLALGELLWPAGGGGAAT